MLSDRARNPSASLMAASTPGRRRPSQAKVMPDGRLSLLAELRKKHGLAQGGVVIVEDIGDAIVLRTLDQVVARA